MQIQRAGRGADVYMDLCQQNKLESIFDRILLHLCQIGQTSPDNKAILPV